MPLSRTPPEALAEEDLAYVPPPGAAPQTNRRAPAGAAPPADPPADMRRRPAPPPEEEAPDDPDAWDDAEIEEEEEEEADTPVRVRRRGRPRSAGLTRGQQRFVEAGGLIVFGALPYGLDMACTVLGLTRALLPATTPGLAVAAVFHIFTSLGQRYFLVQRGPIRLAGALLLGVNTITNLYGAIPALDRLLGPEFLGAIPRDPAAWPGDVAAAAGAWLAAALGSLAGAAPGAGAAWPAWLAGAAALTLACALVAWWSEILLAYFLRRVQAVWGRR